MQEHHSGERLPDGTPTRLAVQCKRCGGWLVSAASVARRMGPACARSERADAARAMDAIPLFDLETR
ncbi:hypothetical protein FEK35_27195 [Nocardia cyriacigeorgica]|uniref:Uncharacterized protein n=1 Tax=Nocardia cyriacigeorgica TaxID=135487 RepID=A0A5R8P652_9NOCA|nr:DUF6011 domain-containing protein [Nocardia cyriacigeorgica]TLF96780.1 hypothetical protein FEK35_27195 [Nocardia cyriacigeorgica]